MGLEWESSLEYLPSGQKALGSAPSTRTENSDRVVWFLDGDTTIHHLKTAVVAKETLTSLEI